MLILNYDGRYHNIRPTVSGILDFTITGARGGNGGADAYHSGGDGLSGLYVTGSLFLAANQEVACIIGSAGSAGQSNVRGGGGGVGGWGEGYVGYSYGAFGGGTGGGAGPSGTSGAGGGGGGATTLRYTGNGALIAVAAGGGGGGGAGNYSNGYAQHAQYLAVSGSNNPGGKGQDHVGDGGGAGGGGGGYPSGAGGTKPSGDNGAMSGSTGWSYLAAGPARQWFKNELYNIPGYFSAGTASQPNGWAAFSFTQTSIYVGTTEPVERSGTQGGY